MMNSFNYDRNLFKKYFQAFQNLPDECTSIEKIEYINKPRHVHEISNYSSHPIRIIKDTKKDEIFVPMYHTELTPNIMPKRYFISNHGRIYDCFRERYVAVVEPKDSNMGSKQMHYPVADPTCIKDPMHLYWPVLKMHRLVCFYFHYFPGCANYQVNHKDSNKNNNKADNLEWVDNIENEKHRYREGKYKHIGKGENQHKSKQKEKDVRLICKLLKEGKKQVEIMKITGCTMSMVQKIAYKQEWTDISREYDLPDLTLITRRYISKEQAEEICKMLSEGKSVIEICKATGCNSKQVLGIKFDGLFPETRHKYGL